MRRRSRSPFFAAVELPRRKPHAFQSNPINPAWKKGSAEPLGSPRFRWHGTAQRLSRASIRLAALLDTSLPLSSLKSFDQCS